MKPILVLLLSKQGALQNGLLALLTTIPQINTVLVAEDADSGWRVLQDHRPGLLLLDMALPGGDADTLLIQLKSESLPIRSIALVDSVQQGEQAESFGADGILLKGFSASTLIATIADINGHQE